MKNNRQRCVINKTRYLILLGRYDEGIKIKLFLKNSIKNGRKLNIFYKNNDIRCALYYIGRSCVVPI